MHVIQGDIYKLPFANNTFPFVYSLGVLQHTPDVANAFACLPPLVEEVSYVLIIIGNVSEPCSTQNIFLDP